MASGVYALELPSGSYIGSAKNLQKRREKHMRLLRNGTHVNPHLQAGYDKFGLVGWRVLVVCEPFELLMYEQKLIDARKPSYNIRLLVHSNLGYRHSEETKRKIGDALRGVSRPPLSATHRQHLSNALKGHIPWNKGIPRTQAVKDKLRVAHLGKKLSLEHRAAIGASIKGTKQSPEWVRKRIMATTQTRRGHGE
jgi:group I intron endonuclease